MVAINKERESSPINRALLLLFHYLIHPNLEEKEVLSVFSPLCFFVREKVVSPSLRERFSSYLLVFREKYFVIFLIEKSSSLVRGRSLNWVNHVKFRVLYFHFTRILNSILAVYYRFRKADLLTLRTLRN